MDAGGSGIRSGHRLLVRTLTAPLAQPMAAVRIRPRA
jgi:hypothetical protein